MFTFSPENEYEFQCHLDGLKVSLNLPSSERIVELAVLKLWQSMSNPRLVSPVLALKLLDSKIDENEIWDRERRLHDLRSGRSI